MARESKAARADRAELSDVRARLASTSDPRMVASLRARASELESLLEHRASRARVRFQGFGPTFTARAPGTCEICGGPIEPTSHVRASTDPYQPGRLVHSTRVSCIAASLPYEDRARAVKDGAPWEKHANPSPSSFKARAMRDTVRTEKKRVRDRVVAAEEKTRAARAHSLEVAEDARAKMAAARAKYAASRKERDDLRELAREYRLIYRAERARELSARAQSRRRSGPSITKVRESDDAVRANLPPELHATWDHVKGSIKGSARMSRTEAFLHWAHTHPSELLHAIEEASDDDYEAQARAHYARQNPAELVALGWVASLELADGSRARVPRGVLLAYTPSAKVRGLVLVYGVKTSRARPPASALKEYKRTHWGQAGAFGIASGDAPVPSRASARHAAPVLARVIYTTRKGGDSALVDYDHAFEGGRPRLVLCQGGRFQIVGGTYRVTDRGIVG